MSVYFKLQDKIGTIIFDRPDAKVNVLDADTLTKFSTILDEVRNNAGIKALCLTSRKKDIFIAGADIKEIESITESADGAAKAKAGQDIFNKLEDLSIPTIAVIDGVALGGGCELALSCRYRIATFNEKVKIGLPEVSLGILPGFGGTYRLPKLIGLTAALKMILSGKPVSGQQALRSGLVDSLMPSAGLENFLVDFIQKIGSSPAKRKKKKKGLSSFLDDVSFGQALVLHQSKKQVLKMTKGFYPAPLKALEVVKKNLGAKREAALKREAVAFSQLVITDICKNLVSVFFLSEQYRKLMPEECADVDPDVINKCGVLGAGVMGGGIAQILSYKDIVVRMKDIHFDAVAQGLRTAQKVFGQAVKRRRLNRAQAELKMAKISGSVDYSGFENADCVIEAVIENMEIKKQVFKEISEVVPTQKMLATNTSALSVTEMARAANDPTRVVGFHFFNPVHRMPLVEIIKTEATSVQTLSTALSLAKRLNKIPVIVKDAPGFLVNRILLAFINEAGRLLDSGEDMARLDRIMVDFGMPMGPFVLSDEVGLDVGSKVLHILHEGLGERFSPSPIFERINQKGLLGKKGGKGFYLHKGKKRRPNPEVDHLRKHSKKDYPLQAKELEKRMTFVMMNEASRCLEDGIVGSAADVDIGMIMGTGFPPFRGGLLKYADTVGPMVIVNELTAMADRFSLEYLKPSPYLSDLAKQQKCFY